MTGPTQTDPLAAPKVTVLMPVYNGECYLREAISSILAQTYRDFEFLIVNDGSTDRSREIALSFGDPRIRIVDHPKNLGLVPALNRGLREARGEWIVRADADDVNGPQRIARQIEWAERHGLDVCFADWVRCGDGPEETVEDSGRSWTVAQWRALFFNAYGAHPSVSYRRQTALEAGAYDPDYHVVEDYDLWDRCRTRGARFGCLPFPAVRHRKHAQSVTSRLRDIQQANTERVSFRAMRRAMPELSDAQARSLRWVLWGQWTKRSAQSQAVGLCLVEAFVARHFDLNRLTRAERREVWADVADSLFWRMHKMNTRAESGRCARLWLRSALRAGWKYRFPGIRLVVYSFQKARLVFRSRLGKRRPTNRTNLHE